MRSEDGRAAESLAEKMQSEAGKRTVRSLLAVIADSPIPTTPLGQMRYLEERGLALLELSSRLDHVKRQSERLTLVDQSHLQRSIALDVDLSRLSPRRGFRSQPSSAET
jgi:hypothetical protein